MARGKARRPDPAPISFDEFWRMRAALDRAASRASARLRAIPGVGSGAMGLTPDSVKARPDYREALASYRAAESALRQFNGAFAKRFARQSAARIRAEREAKAAAMRAEREGVTP
jgi:hypothetical protein